MNRFTNLWDTIKHTKIYTMGVPEDKRAEKNV